MRKKDELIMSLRSVIAYLQSLPDDISKELKTTNNVTNDNQIKETNKEENAEINNDKNDDEYVLEIKMVLDTDVDEEISKLPEISSDFEELKKLLMSDEWPLAIPERLIANPNSEVDKKERGESIFHSYINENLEGKSFLDFGCGEGHVVISASQAKTKPNKVVGYDIERRGNKSRWENESDGYLLTTNYQNIISNAPYDVILLYDVLDHAFKESPTKIMSNVKSLLKPNGTVYVRCHPWCSRHGGHLYRKINKAFVHLVFTEDELKTLGFNEESPTRKVIHPITNYNNWFTDVGFKIKSQEIDSQPPEDFFKKNEIIANRIKQNWVTSPFKQFKLGEEYPAGQMKQSFVDFVLTA